MKELRVELTLDYQADFCSIRKNSKKIKAINSFKSRRKVKYGVVEKEENNLSEERREKAGK